MPNKWTIFVKEWASKNNMSYGCAMTKPECKEAYRKENPVPSKSTKKRAKKVKASDVSYEKLEEAIPTESQAKKPINLKIKEKPKKEKPIKIIVHRIKINDVEYYIDKENNLFNPLTKEHIGILDRVNKKIIPAESDDEEGAGLGSSRVSDEQKERKRKELERKIVNIMRTNKIEPRVAPVPPVEAIPIDYNNEEIRTETTPIPRGRGIEGGALKDWVSPTAWKEYGQAMIYGRNDYQPKARQIIRKFGEKKILKMYACRNPVQQLLTAALNAVSFGQFNKNWENQPYDKLFHLSLRVELDTQPQTTIAIEKTDAVTLTANPSIPGNKMECEFIPFNGELTLNQLLQGGQAFMKDKFFTYSARDNNCQDFIMGLLRGSNIGTQENYDFIKQDTKELFKGLPGTRKISNTITDLGAVMNVAVQGAGVHKGENYYVQSVVFDKSKFDVKQAKDWIKKNNYALKKPADVTDTQIRFRQVGPAYIKKMGYNRFRTKKIGRNSGISLIISYK